MATDKKTACGSGAKNDGQGVAGLLSVVAGSALGSFIRGRPAFVLCSECECRVDHRHDCDGDECKPYPAWCIRHAGVEDLQDRNQLVPVHRQGCYEGVPIIKGLTQEEFERALAESDPGCTEALATHEGSR